MLACTRCGLSVTRPDEGPEELAARYPRGYEAYELPSRRLAALISRAIRAWQAWRGFRGPPLAAAAALEPGRAVDVGCGRGDLGAELVSRGWQVTGVEPSQAACDVAASRGIDARCGLLADVALEQGAYRLVTFQHSLEHVNDPVADLRRVANALAPGGLCLVTVPHFGGWQARRFRSRWYHLDLPRHRVHFTRPALEAAFARAQLEPVHISTSSSAIGLPASVQYALFGRCLFPRGMPLRVATAAAALLYPLAWLLDRVRGGGDLLHAVARKRD